MPRDDLQLWQVALRHLTEGQINWLYPLDRVHIIRLLRDLHAVGERPEVKTLRAYAKGLWPEWGASERWVCDRWREIRDNPARRFRFMKDLEYEEQPFHLMQYLIEENGLEPLESRIDRVAHTALDAYGHAAVGGSRDEFDASRRALDQAVRSIVLLRRARFGGPFEDR